ncbi:MAG: thioesterase [bacterium]|nr:thioesterase [bacterium]MXV89531.1 thioesterase [Acidimicrobiia bacterium]MYC46330.1 thioesterase [Acidimicrobiia bacterium]MYI19987.1 thioesterase [Acidimicrobiia bacterium]
MVLEPGARGGARRTVGETDTGASVGSSDLPILATPILLALGEAATIDALAGALPGGSTSVSMRVHFDHVRPIPVGRPVFATALLERVEGRRLTFSIEARDEAGDLVGSGRIVRIVVDRRRFEERIPPAQ